MFTAPISSPTRWRPFLHSTILLHSLDWIIEKAGTAAEGIYELGEPGWYVNVHSYQTQARELCTWENHLATIDLQYLIEGNEGIDIADVASLGAPAVFKPESDTQKFADNAQPATQLILGAGDFAIFLPGEAHRPKIAIQTPAALRKLVVKIPIQLLG